MPSRHGQNTRDAPRRPPRSSKRRSSERIGVSDSRELEPESRHGSDRESRRIARQKSSWPQQLPLLIVCSMCLTGLIGLVTMHAALQNTHHNTWIERSRNLFQRRAGAQRRVQQLETRSRRSVCSAPRAARSAMRAGLLPRRRASASADLRTRRHQCGAAAATSIRSSSRRSKRARGSSRRPPPTSRPRRPRRPRHPAVHMVPSRSSLR